MMSETESPTARVGASRATIWPDVVTETWMASSLTVPDRLRFYVSEVRKNCQFAIFFDSRYSGSNIAEIFALALA